MTGEFLCVLCPNGCSIDAEFTEDKPPKLISFTGAKCMRGRTWIRQEIEHPLRTISTSVPVQNGDMICASVRTDKPIPLEKVMEVMAEIRHLCPQAPVAIGEVLLDCPAGTDAKIVVTRNVSRID